MKPIRQTRNEVVELVRGGGKTVQEHDGRLRRVPGLAVEEREARNVGGLGIHGIISLLQRCRSRFLDLMKLNCSGHAIYLNRKSDLLNAASADTQAAFAN